MAKSKENQAQAQSPEAISAPAQALEEPETTAPDEQPGPANAAPDVPAAAPAPEHFQEPELFTLEELAARHSVPN